MNKILHKVLVLVAGVAFGSNTNAQVFTEGFEDGAVPTGWTQEQVVGTKNWVITDENGNNTISPRTGGYMAHFQVSSTSRSDKTKLITPQLDLTSLTIPELNFYFANVAWGSDITELRVFYKSNAADSWTQIGLDYTTAHSTWTEVSLALPNPSNDYYIAFEGKASYARGVNIDDIIVREGPSCPSPTALSAINITSNSADLVWEETGNATLWNIEYGLAGFTQGEGSLESDLTSSMLSIDISPSMSYEFYVQSNCGEGEFSPWFGPYYFSNQYCDVSTNSSNEYLTNIETSNANLDVSYSATSQPEGSYSDETNQVIQSYVTQTFDVNTTYSSGANGVNIWVDWNNDFSFQDDELVSSESGSSDSKTLSVNVPVGTEPGNYRMRIRGQWGGTANPPACGSVAYGSTIDFTLTIVEAPSCLPVMNIETLSSTPTSVELEWEEYNSSTEWNIEYGEAGFIAGTGTTLTAGSNPFTITALDHSTEYDFYIQSSCSDSDQSVWRGPHSVYTACGIVEAPFYEGFNTGVQPQCWENLSSNTTSTSVNNLWNFDDQGDYAAANNGRMAGTFTKVDGNFPYSDSVMLITPQIDISQLTNPFLSFEWFSNNTNYPGDNLPLIIEVFNGTTWNLLDTLRGDNPEWQFENFNLSAYSTSIIQIRFMVNKSVAVESAFYNDILLDEVRVDGCNDLGGVDGLFNACRLDNTVNLNDNIIVKPNGDGKWSFPSQPSYLTEDSIFNVSFLPAGSYELFYVERTVCYDTTFATINVFNVSSAGTDGTLSVCKNEPVNLFDALSGNVDLGGDWYDFSANLLPNSQPKAEPIPGQYNYTYVANNGVCPSDTAIVEVGVLANCDFLSLSDELFTDISVYPNPASDQLSIVNPSNASSLKVEMMDMNGRVVLIENKALNNASDATLAIDHLEKGIYTLRVYNNEGQKTFKIVKQ